MRDEQGSVTVVTVGVIAVGLLLVVGLVAVGQLAAGRIQATNAADAAALAAAPVTFRPFGAEGSPLDEAAIFAAANGAEVVACRCPLDSSYAQRTVTVTVQIEVDVVGYWGVTIRATSSAEFRPTVLLLGP